MGSERRSPGVIPSENRGLCGHPRAGRRARGGARRRRRRRRAVVARGHGRHRAGPGGGRRARARASAGSRCSATTTTSRCATAPANPSIEHARAVLSEDALAWMRSRKPASRWGEAIQMWHGGPHNAVHEFVGPRNAPSCLELPARAARAGRPHPRRRGLPRRDVAACGSRPASRSTSAPASGSSTPARCSCRRASRRWLRLDLEALTATWMAAPFDPRAGRRARPQARVRAMSTQVVVAKLEGLTGRAAELRQLLADRASAVRAEPGCVGYEVAERLDEPVALRDRADVGVGRGAARPLLHRGPRRLPARRRRAAGHAVRGRPARGRRRRPARARAPHRPTRAASANRPTFARPRATGSCPV